ncbi:MAG TPA: universal stress protein [Syntrophorhabdaceae bacterium]|nr:universal stress protein [Syntrophorhabdaceae bacterium]
MLKPTKILVPTDFSAYSDKALEQALDIARQYNAQVFLLHVIEHDMDFLLGLYPTYSEELVRMIKNHPWNEAEENIKKQLAKFSQVREVKITTKVCQGVAYQEILEEAKDKGIDLIVIASLGRSGIAKYLIGGVARNVLKGSTCPVLLTK